MSYSLKSVKTGSASEGGSFYANLYAGTARIASLEDHGDGGGVFIRWNSPALQETHEEALFTWATEHDETLRREDGAFIEGVGNLLVEIYENNKKSKKGLIFVKSKAQQAWEQTFYFIKDSSVGDIARLQHLVAEHPDARVWEPTLAKFALVRDLIPA